MIGGLPELAQRVSSALRVHFDERGALTTDSETIGGAMLVAHVQGLRVSVVGEYECVTRRQESMMELAAV